jgi:hypothetical protein
MTPNNLLFIGSTGRTATTFVAASLNRLPEMLACHEGHGFDKNKKNDPLIPLINIESRLVYEKKISGLNLVNDKRSFQVLSAVLKKYKKLIFCDVGYYNSVLGSYLIKIHKSAKFVGIIRDCKSFVRSATCISGEDKLPVGWPANTKPLSSREKFIKLGRLRPRSSDPYNKVWKNFTAISKNIWLWRETNMLLMDTKKRYPRRSLLISFETLSKQPDLFWAKMQKFLPSIDLSTLMSKNQVFNLNIKNKKKGGYQIPAFEHWSNDEKKFANIAQKEIDLIWSKL